MDFSYKILIYGHRGYLGGKLFQKMKKAGFNVFKTNIRYPDENLSTFLDAEKFDIIINCACKKDKELKLSNIDLPIFLVKRCKQFIHFCTDDVYSGEVGNYNKKSEHDPVSSYGTSKSIIAKALSGYNNSHIIRTSFVGKHPECSMWKGISQGNFSGWDNYYWSGVLIEDLIAEICSNLTYILSCSLILIGGNRQSKYEVALKLSENKFPIKRKILPKTIDKSYSSDIHLPF